MPHPVKAIVHPVIDGRVKSEGVVVLAPKWWERLIAFGWQVIKASGLVLIGYVLGQF